MIDKTENHKEDPNKNYYLVMGIIMAFLVFMIATVWLVSYQVSQGSSAQRYNKRKSAMMVPAEIRQNSFLDWLYILPA